MASAPVDARRRPARLVAVALAVAVAFWGAPAQGASSASAEDRWVNSTLAKMTLQEKVGQLFVVNCYGISVRDPDPPAVAANQNAYKLDNFEQVISKYKVGGIFYFGSNYQNPLQLVGLSNGIQHVETNQRVPVPALISTDQEGGTVQAVGSPAALFPGNMGQGASGDAGAAGDAASVMGQELRAMGMSPVLTALMMPL